MRQPLSAQQAHLVPGYRLDRYELLLPYAHGGMATVWLARLEGKHGFQKLVAVKTILPHFAGEEAFRTMFLDEARIASRIRHPNVAEIDDLGEEDGVLYLVLEWIEGDSLMKLYEAVKAAKQPFPMNLLLRIAADACAGLHAAHGLRDENGELLNVVHRDVSPQNILVSSLGVTKVIDFGIAKARDRTGERTKTGMIKGKIEYTAPEQALMKPVDCRADVWAMGVLLYQLLADRLPFEGKNDLDTLRQLASGKKPKPLPPTVPPTIADVVMRALTFDVEKRLPTALDLQRALEQAMPQSFSQADVAAFVNTFLADRIAARKQSVAKAVAEAQERAKARASYADLGDAARRASYPDLGQARAPMPSVPQSARGPMGSIPEARPPMPSVPQARPPMPSVPQARPPSPSIPPARGPMGSIPAARSPSPSLAALGNVAPPPAAPSVDDARPTDRIDPFAAFGAPPPSVPSAAPTIPTALDEAPTTQRQAPPPSRAGVSNRHIVYVGAGLILMLGVFGIVALVLLRDRPAPDKVRATAEAPAPTTSHATPAPPPAASPEPPKPAAAPQAAPADSIEELTLDALPPATVAPRASSKPPEAKSADGSAAQPKTNVDAKPAETKAVDAKPADTKAADKPKPKPPTKVDDGF